MRQEIDRLLESVSSKCVNMVGPYWQIRVGKRAGAREDGVSLARDLLSRHAADLAAEEVLKEIAMSRPDSAYTAKPEPIEIPAFLSEPKPEPNPVPEAIRDLIRENEPHGEAQDRLLALYRSLGNKLMLNLASEADGRLHSRLHGSLRWIDRGAVDVTGKV